jgi:hypothetical protein
LVGKYLLSGRNDIREGTGKARKFENSDTAETERKKGRGVIERLCFA